MMEKQQQKTNLVMEAVVGVVGTLLAIPLVAGALTLIAFDSMCNRASVRPEKISWDD